MHIAILGLHDPRNAFVEFVCSCGMDAIVVERGCEGRLSLGSESRK